jgi:hypothetical protein
MTESEEGPVDWKKPLFLALAITFGLPLLAQKPPVLFETPMSPRNASYAISVKLDAATHALKGHETVRWRNITGQTATDAWFHLYLNAFANNQSLFMKESEGQHREFGFDYTSWGYCRVTAIAQVLPDGTEVPLKQIFPGPGRDRSVMRVELAAPVPPQGETAFEVTFEDQLPKVFARSGFAGTFNMVGQWFPKLGVFQGEKGWNCHPYHVNSEFFSDFGVYDVAVTVPKEYVVGATGIQWSESAAGKEKTLRFHAEDVHDFAWTASPDFLDESREWKGVRIRVLMQGGNRADMPRYFEAEKRALDWFEKKLWKYPYPQITIVDPAAGGEGAGGMEYPTLITAGTSPFLPKGLLLPEMVVVHEFGHNYWYGMSANNEFEEAWLDEGITSYYEMRILDDWFGPGRSFLKDFCGWHFGDSQTQKIQYMAIPDLAPIVLESWKFPGFGSYASMEYSKSALVLKTLEGILGREEMDRAMKVFFSRAKFTHPTTEEFIQILSETAGRDLAPLLKPLLYGTGTVDFRVARVKSTYSGKPKGFDLDQEPPKSYAGEEKKKGAPEKSKKADKESRSYDSVVVVQRKGDLVLPVEVLVTFDDGTDKREAWSGEGRIVTFTYKGPKVAKVTVDPDGKVPLDLQRLNNGWVLREDPLPARSLTTRWRVIFQSLPALLGLAL